MIDFSKFQKPQRYIGNEWNVVKKTHQDRIRICVSYPEDYLIGMSNLGLRIVYGVLNEFEDVVCERVFLPGPDLREHFKNNCEKLFSLESKTALDEFDVIGFNLDYELNILNALSILSDGGIPIMARERPDLIVLVGAVANPEPFADFVDVFFLGEFEEGAKPFVDVLRRFQDKESRLRALSEIPGFYVPRFYQTRLEGSRYVFNKLHPAAQFPLRRVFVKDLDSAYYPRKWLVPHTTIIHDRIPIEIARGCPNGCKFCQARAVYFPYRERKVSTIRALVEEMYERTGYENISFLALSAADYSSMEALIDETFDYCKARNIGISLPSLRVDDVIGGFYKKLVSLKTISLTLAVEAARKGLRDAMDKKIDIDKLLDAAKLIRSLNIRHLKIYFMFGFASETDDDLLAIGEFLRKVSGAARIRLNVSINVFVPKPHSAWEAEPMQDLEELKRRRDRILKGIGRVPYIKVNISRPEKSILEAIFSRADREFSRVIAEAHRRHLSLDNLSLDTLWPQWLELMEASGIDYRKYLRGGCDSPWSLISSAHCEGE